MSIQSLFVAFPGQGSQYLGMGKSVFDNYQVARNVFYEVDDALGYKLSNIIFGQNEHDLTATYNAQPALMCVSIAILKVLEEESGKKIYEIASLACGHSLGEYSALCASGAISLYDTAKILAIRGKSMNEAAPVGTGGMAAILGATDEQINELLQKTIHENEVLVIANDNSVGQTVISGSIEAINRSITIARDMGIKRALKLPVSGPFHSPLMKPAQEKMRVALDDITIKKPAVPVIANFTATPSDNPEDIKKLLIEQITGSVKWRESILYAQGAGYNTMVEIGSGKVLGGLTKRITNDINSVSIETQEDILSYVSNL